MHKGARVCEQLWAQAVKSNRTASLLCLCAHLLAAECDSHFGGRHAHVGWAVSLTSATPAPKVATNRLEVALLKPLSCSHSVKNTIACQGKQPTMPCSTMACMQQSRQQTADRQARAQQQSAPRSARHSAGTACMPTQHTQRVPGTPL